MAHDLLAAILGEGVHAGCQVVGLADFEVGAHLLQGRGFGGGQGFVEAH